MIDLPFTEAPTPFYLEEKANLSKSSKMAFSDYPEFCAPYINQYSKDSTN